MARNLLAERRYAANDKREEGVSLVVTPHWRVTSTDSRHRAQYEPRNVQWLLTKSPAQLLGGLAREVR